MEMNSKTLDSFYKKCFTKWIVVDLKDEGFKRMKTNSVARITDDLILQFINFHKGPSKSRTFNVHVAIRPLYIPHEKAELSPGKRLDWIIYDKSSWWSLRDEKSIEESFMDINNNIHKYVLPMFDKLKNTNDIITEFLNNRYNLNIADNILSRYKDLGYMYMHEHDFASSKKCFEDALKDLNYFSEIHPNVNFTLMEKSFNSLLSVLSNSDDEISMYLDNCLRISRENLGIKDL